MSFPLAGNDRIKSSVLAAIGEKRIPHAVLIEGDIGTGRHTLARFLAAAAVCTGENTPCGDCHACTLASSGNHPDISVTAPEEGKKNIAVSQIRNLRSEAFVKPHMAEKKVFIIDMADTMNEQSQNALLKILEEPPEAVIFILIAESKAALLETVISRCTVLTLSVPAEAEALDYIKHSVSFSETEISNALENTKNNIGAALAFLEGNKDTKTADAAKKFLEFMLKGDELSMLNVTSGFEKSRIDTGKFIKDLKYYTGALLREKCGSMSAARALNSFYSELSVFEQSLETNINLSLLFCAIVSKAAEIIRK